MDIAKLFGFPSFLRTLKEKKQKKLKKYLTVIIIIIKKNGGKELIVLTIRISISTSLKSRNNQISITRSLSVIFKEIFESTFFAITGFHSESGSYQYNELLLIQYTFIVYEIIFLSIAVLFKSVSAYTSKSSHCLPNLEVARPMYFRSAYFTHIYRSCALLHRTFSTLYSRPDAIIYMLAYFSISCGVGLNVLRSSGKIVSRYVRVLPSSALSSLSDRFSSGALSQMAVQSTREICSVIVGKFGIAGFV